VQLGELQGYYGEFQDAGVHVYAISVDPPEHNARLKARLGAGYEILSDERGELLDALDIRHARRSATGKERPRFPSAGCHPSLGHSSAIDNKSAGDRRGCLLRVDSKQWASTRHVAGRPQAA
jgi:hypothetical protein